MTDNRISVGPLDAKDWPSVEEIFFLSSSRQNFDSDGERSAFRDQWLGYYRDREPERAYVAREMGGRVTGYLTGCANSHSAGALFQDIPSYRLFEDQFTEYPAHFHINCHPDWRGRGIGTLLVRAFVTRCAHEGRSGVHIVTAASARNTVFYRRCGFGVEIRRRWEDSDLLFMAMPLSPASAKAGPR